MKPNYSLKNVFFFFFPSRFIMAPEKKDRCPLSCVNPVLFSYLPLSLCKNEQLYIATGQVLRDRRSAEPVSGGE